MLLFFFFWGEHTHKENVIPSGSGTEQRKLETWQKQNLKVPLHLLYLEILLGCGLNFIFKRGRGWKQGETCLSKIFLGLPFGLKLCGFYTSGGDWSTPSLCLLVFSVIPSHSSGTWIHLFWARMRGTQPLFLRGGRCIYLQHSSAHGMGSNQANSWCSSCLALFLLSRS